MKRRKYLSCSCCGNSFRGIQYHDHDTGFGTCSKCCYWILTREDWSYDHDRIKALMKAQWPDALPLFESTRAMGQ